MTTAVKSHSELRKSLFFCFFSFGWEMQLFLENSLIVLTSCWCEMNTMFLELLFEQFTSIVKKHKRTFSLLETVFIQRKKILGENCKPGHQIWFTILQLLHAYPTHLKEMNGLCRAKWHPDGGIGQVDYGILKNRCIWKVFFHTVLFETFTL